MQVLQKQHCKGTPVCMFGCNKYTQLAASENIHNVGKIVMFNNKYQDTAVYTHNYFGSVKAFDCISVQTWRYFTEECLPIIIEAGNYNH